MHEELQTFLESPTARTYRRVREALLEEMAAGEVAATSGSALAELADLAAAEDYAALLKLTDDLQPAWALSPRVHFYAALAAEALGESEIAEIERFTCQSCLDGILATGDGTADAPYLITYLSDEYDVLMALGLEPRSQVVVDRQGMLCDVARCADGEQVWFELSGLVHDPREHFADMVLLQGLRR